MSKIVRVGAVQSEPVWLDLEGSVNKTIYLIEKAAADGVNVLGFSRGLDSRVSMVGHGP